MALINAYFKDYSISCIYLFNLRCTTTPVKCMMRYVTCMVAMDQQAEV